LTAQLIDDRSLVSQVIKINQGSRIDREDLQTGYWDWNKFYNLFSEMFHRKLFIIQQHIRLCQRVPRKDHDPQRRRWRGMFADGRKSLDITPVVKRMSFSLSPCIFRIYGYINPSIILVLAMSIKNFRLKNIELI